MWAWRPTDYSEEMLLKARQYLENCKDEYDLKTTSEIIQNKNIEWLDIEEKKQTKSLKLKVNLPTIEWLAKYINVNKSTIYEWIKKKECIEFSNLYNEIMEEQAQRLINMSLSWDYNPAITKILLSKHWYIEKIETDNNIKVETNLTEVIQWIENWELDKSKIYNVINNE